jgi:hypothetical protein
VALAVLRECQTHLWRILSRQSKACAALAWTLGPPCRFAHTARIDGHSHGGDADYAASPIVPPKPRQDQCRCLECGLTFGAQLRPGHAGPMRRQRVQGREFTGSECPPS